MLTQKFNSNAISEKQSQLKSENYLNRKNLDDLTEIS